MQHLAALAALRVAELPVEDEALELLDLGPLAVLLPRVVEVVSAVVAEVAHFRLAGLEAVDRNYCFAF